MTSKRELYAFGEPLGECVTRKEAGRLICGGGGSGGGTSTTSQNIPDELRPLASKYAQDAIALSNKQYQAYGGDRFADVNGAQQAGIGSVMNRALGGSQTINNAENALNQNIQGGQTNPYLDSMVQKAQGGVMGNMAALQARSGSFGNSGIAEQGAKQMGDIASNMYGQAYETDRGRQMQSIGMAQQFGNQAYQDANQLMNVGNFMQDQQQQKADFGYQQFQEQQNDPYKKLSAMSGIFQSAPGQSSTTQSSGGGK